MENAGIIRLEGAKVIFKNFSGEASQYNQAGNRNFGVLLPEEMVDTLIRDGWPVKRFSPDENGFEQAYMKIKVKYGKVSPTAYLVTRRGKMKLDETNIGQLDYLRVLNYDLIIRPYNYPPIAGRPNGGIAAYLKSIYATVEEDYIEEKYADLPILNS